MGVVSQAPMATQGVTSPFVWGDNGRPETPAQAAAQQQIADALIARQQAPQNVGQGLNAIGQALLAKSLLARSTAAIQSGQQQATSDFANVLSDPSTAMNFIANDQYATPGQQSVAQALLQQRMMLTNPDMIAQRANLSADTNLKTAQAAEMTQGGPAAGTPFQDSNGNWFIPTQYGGARQIAGPGGPLQPGNAPVPLAEAPPVPAVVAPGASLPASSAGMGGGLPPANASTPVPLATLPPAAPVATPFGPSSNAPAGTPVFLTPAQQKGAEAQAAAAGTALGTAPVDVNAAISSSRAVNPLYSAGINNINGALNMLANDKSGAIDTTAGLGSLLKNVPGSPAYNFGKALSSLQGLSALATMGNERGAAGGSTPVQVRNQQEFAAVAQAAGSLDQGQSRADIVNSLKSLKAQLVAGMNNRAQDIADLRTLGKLSGGIPASTAADPFAGPGAYGLIQAAPDGRPVVSTPQEAAAFPVGTVVIMPNGSPGTVTPQFKAAFGATAQ